MTSPNPNDAETTMNGTAGEAVLPQLLGDIYLGRKSGILQLGGDRLSLFFRDGRVLRVGDVDNGSPPALPGPTDTLSLRLDRIFRLLDIAIESRPQPATTRDGVLSALRWSEPAPAFEEREPAATEDPALNLSIEEIIREAVRQLTDPALIRGLIGDFDRILVLPGAPGSDDALTPTDAYILSRVDGTLSAREVMGLIPLDPEEVERSLLGLLLTGVVETKTRPPRPPAAATAVHPVIPVAAAAPPASAEPDATVELPAAASVEAASAVSVAPKLPARALTEDQAREVAARRREIVEAYEGLRSRTHFEILGISESANDQQVKEAYFRLAKRFHPDVHQDSELEDMKDHLEAVFMRLGSAYEVLRNPLSRSNYASTLSRRRALEAGMNVVRSIVTPGPAQSATPPPAPVLPSGVRRPAPSSQAPPAASPPAGSSPATAEEPGLLESAENFWKADEDIHRAERLLAEEKFWDAIQLLNVAIPRMYGKKQKQKARILRAKAYVKNPNWMKRAEEELQAVLQEDPQSSDAYFTLGVLYKESGMNSRAITMLRKAIELNPQHKQAQAELSTLSSAALIRKLFGRS
jgi:curved DNA-binding protein CbpA